MNLKIILITLSCIALAFFIVTFYVVFYSGSGTYVVSSDTGPDAGIFSTSTGGAGVSTTASSTASSSPALASSSSPGGGASSTESGGGTQITWTQGSETMTITGAMVSGSQLTLGVQVAMGSASECVPLNLRMIADEQGDLAPPITQQFTFPDTGTCTGTAGETYSAQPVVFTLPTPTTFPLILTTGGTANILFEVVQSPDGSVSVQLPPSSD